MTSSTSDKPCATPNRATAIVEAAARLFSEQGFDGVSMSAIARAADISKATVFHHFGSKAELYVEVMRHAHETFSRHLHELSADGSQGLEGKFRELAHSHLANILDHERLARLFMRELLAAKPKIENERVSDLFSEEFSRFVQLLRGGQESGCLRPDFNPAAAVSLLVGANLFFFQARDIIRGYPEVDFADEPERYTNAISDLIWRSLVCADTQTPSADDNQKSK